MISTGIGRLSRDPKMSYTPKGTAQTIISLAVNTGFGDKAKTVWMSLISWGQQAELINEKFSKGQRMEFCADITEIRAYIKDDGTAGAQLDGKILTFNWVDKAEGGSKKKDDTFAPPEDGSFEWEE